MRNGQHDKRRTIEKHEHLNRNIMMPNVKLFHFNKTCNDISDSECVKGDNDLKSLFHRKSKEKVEREKMVAKHSTCITFNIMPH